MCLEILTRYRPSKFVLSEDGKIVQKKIWKETFEIFKKEAPEVNISEFES